MKKICLFILFTLFAKSVSLAQDAWMTGFEAAKRLALAQDKMLLVVWDQSTFYPLPVLVKDNQGGQVILNNLFESDAVIDLLWEHFVLVKLDESSFLELYNGIKDKRSFSYLDKFSDDSLKIMDANGNILITTDPSGYVLDVFELIQKYALNTSFIKQELINYRNDQNFYTAFYLGSKYIDYAFYANDYIKKELLGLSNIYLEEAKARLESERLDNKEALTQRFELLEIEQELAVGKANKVLRKLKRIDASQLQGANNQLYAFLYYVSYMLENEQENASSWESKVTPVDLEKAKVIINNQ